jgi:hypothetical protein
MKKLAPKAQRKPLVITKETLLELALGGDCECGCSGGCTSNVSCAL